MLNVTNLLRAEGLEALEPLHITAKEYGTFLLLNYSQIDSPKTDPVVMECRGLILDKVTYEPLAQGFERFFNYGEIEGSPMPKSFKGAVVSEKIDGTCITVWHNPHTDKWQCSTRRMGYAEGPVGDTSLTFKDLFERALGATVNEYFYDEYPTDRTFVFELVSPESRVTKRYASTEIYLINWRTSGEEAALGTWSYYYQPETYPLNSITDCIAAAKALPEQDEGFVVRWPDGFRLKIKNPAHVALAHLRNNGAMTDKRIIPLLDSGGAEEYLLHFPEDSPRFEALRCR